MSSAFLEICTVGVLFMFYLVFLIPRQHKYTLCDINGISTNASSVLNFISTFSVISTFPLKYIHDNRIVNNVL
jgi:hypothetical protein